MSWCEGDEHGAPLTIRTPKLSISFLSLPISLPEQWDRMCLHISNGLSDDNFCGFTVADGFVWLPDKDRPETVVLCVLAEVIAGVSVYGSIQQPYRVYWAIFQFHIREHTVLFLYCSSTMRWKIEKKKKIWVCCSWTPSSRRLWHQGKRSLLCLVWFFFCCDIKLE